MVISKAILERLIAAKYLLRDARKTLSGQGAFAAGRCLLTLHDGVEMLLRAAAEQFHATLKGSVAFDQLCDAVNAAAPKPLTHRVALNQLNKARSNFKHFGLEPRAQDAEKLLLDMEGFFPETLQHLLGLSPDGVFLASLIDHRRTKNWIQEAETGLERGDYAAAVDAAAIAFAIYSSHIGRDPDSFRLDRSGRFRRTDLRDLVENIEESLKELQSQLRGVISGVNMADYRKFLRCTPQVFMSMANTFQLHGRRGFQVGPGKDDATFCISFAVDSILTMKENSLAPLRPYVPHPDRRIRVVKATDVIVWPTDPHETIRRAEAGELLLAYTDQPQQNGYLSILDDGDRAFVAEGDVEGVESVGT